MTGLFAAFLAEVGIITYRDLAGKDPSHTIAGLPIPADYLAAVALYGALGLLAGTSEGARLPASLLGWGFVIATAMNLTPAALNPTSTKTKTTKGTVTA